MRAERERGSFPTIIRALSRPELCRPILIPYSRTTWSNRDRPPFASITSLLHRAEKKIYSVEEIVTDSRTSRVRVGTTPAHIWYNSSIHYFWSFRFPAETLEFCRPTLRRGKKFRVSSCRSFARRDIWIARGFRNAYATEFPTIRESRENDSKNFSRLERVGISDSSNSKYVGAREIGRSFSL